MRLTNRPTSTPRPPLVLASATSGSDQILRRTLHRSAPPIPTPSTILSQEEAGEWWPLPRKEAPVVAVPRRLTWSRTTISMTSCSSCIRPTVGHCISCTHLWSNPGLGKFALLCSNLARRVYPSCFRETVETVLPTVHSLSPFRIPLFVEEFNSGSPFLSKHFK